MTRRTATTRRMALGVTVALAAGLGWVGTGLASMASAATPSVSCQTTPAAAKFTPGLMGGASQPKQQKETLSGKLVKCTGSAKITGGSISGTLNSPGPIKCSNLLSGTIGTGNEVLHWTGGTTSTVKATIKVVSTGKFTINGTITAGRFKGHKVTAPMTLDQANPTNPGANCGLANPPVAITQINFAGTTTVS